MRVLLLLAFLAQAPNIDPAAGRPAAAGTVALGRVETTGYFVVDLYADLDALLIGGSPAMPPAQRLAAMEWLRAGGRDRETAAVDRLTELMRRRIRIRFDGTAAELAVDYPERRATASGELATLGSFVRLRARVPAAARAVSFFASRSFRFIDLRTTIAGRTSRQQLEPGEESAPIALR